VVGSAVRYWRATINKATHCADSCLIAQYDVGVSHNNIVCELDVVSTSGEEHTLSTHSRV
jgi:hypothetical protein